MVYVYVVLLDFENDGGKEIVCVVSTQQKAESIVQGFKKGYCFTPKIEKICVDDLSCLVKNYNLYLIKNLV